MGWACSFLSNFDRIWGYFKINRTMYRLNRIIILTAKCKDGWLVKHNVDRGDTKQVISPSFYSYWKNSPSWLSCLWFLAHLFGQCQSVLHPKWQNANKWFLQGVLSRLSGWKGQQTSSAKQICCTVLARPTTRLTGEFLSARIFQIANCGKYSWYITEVSVYCGYSQPFFILSGMKYSSS